MKKSDLKDGMKLESKNGYVCYYLEGELVYRRNKEFVRCDDINDYDENLNALVHNPYSIMKVSYMGEVLWKRKEYYTITEAAMSGKKFKHKDSEDDFKEFIGDAISGFSWIIAGENKFEFSNIELSKVVAEEMNKSVWEIEE